MTSRLFGIAMFGALVLTSTARAQWVPQTPGTDASFRGMSILSPAAAWISGTKGTFAWTENGGREWHAGHVAAASTSDFRAVHAISLDTALLMLSSQDTGRIYRTTDRGATWTLQYDDESKGAFLDAMAFFDSQNGLVLGDPVNGRFVILRTSDGGRHWTHAPGGSLPPSLVGEGAFAASGTSLITCGARDAWFATGGASKSRVFHTSDGGQSWTVAETPIEAGTAAAGIFSLVCRGNRQLVAVGGNYSKPDATAVTVARSNDGGATWTPTAPSPATGFLSGVAYLDAAPSSRRMIAVGTEGTVYSLDSGISWTRLDSFSLNVVMADGNGAAWAAGARGAVAHLTGLLPK
jgi:photosystem II stability/assembly factor-like uncharacterized protein